MGRRLKGDLERSQQNLLTIRAPYDAVILSLWRSAMSAALWAKRTGALPARTEGGANHSRVSMLNESGLAKLKSGSTRAVFLRGVPYERYGALSGKLDWVSLLAVTREQRATFRCAGFDR